MRPIGILLAVLNVASQTFAGVLSAVDAGAHVGQPATVEGTVSEVHTARSGKATFIDLDGNYPNEAFTAVVFARSMAAVGDVSGLIGKRVDISGTIQNYQGRPEIIVTSRAQIRTK